MNTAEECFGHNPRWQVKINKDLTSPRIEALKAESRHIGGSIFLLKSNNTGRVSQSTVNYRDRMLRIHERSFAWQTFEDFLKDKRRSNAKELYHERAREAFEQNKKQDSMRMKWALQSGSTKRLINSGINPVRLPLMVNDPLENDCILSSPEDVKNASATYFEHLYTRMPPPNTPKPWINTESVRNVRARTQQTPFEWPQRASLNSFRAMLQKGNPRPSPGPDEWEKWCIKALSDKTLELMITLHNYIVDNSRFPGNIKEVISVPLYKKGIRTNLANYQGIMLSNFLANSPMTWLNFRLTPYVAKLGIIPETQIATQMGVQSRDLMNFLAGIQTWSTRNKQPVYCIKRDQLKGFDYLSPQGFHDAIRAYGLPESIIHLDQASQSQVPCTIQTAYGQSRKIMIDGVTKQGGPLSPLKATMTTSLGHRWLDDMAKESPSRLVVKSMQSIKTDPHTPDDISELLVTMVEAMDDSYLFATTLHGLQYFCLLMERFQFAYNWLTQWSKTDVYVLNDPAASDMGNSVNMPSITRTPRKSPWNITYYPVRVIRNQLEMLRTMVNDSSS